MENEEEIKEVEEEIEADEEDDCNDFLRMPEIDFDLSIELPTAADLLGYDED